MAFEPLRTDYKDAVWAGLRKYLMLKNEDDTVSLKDVTQYTVYDDAFFGAEDANRINAAINAIMASVEKGTDLYEAFTAFFEAQKKAFTAEADKQNVDFGKYLDGLEQTADADIAKMKDDYTAEIKNFENTQEAVYNTWFDHIKDQLSDDAAGNLQAQIDNDVFKSYRGELENINTAPGAVKSGCYKVFNTGVIYDLLLCFNSTAGSATALQVLLSYDLKKCLIRPAINNGKWGPWRPLAFADDVIKQIDFETFRITETYQMSNPFIRMSALKTIDTDGKTALTATLEDVFLTDDGDVIILGTKGVWFQPKQDQFFEPIRVPASQDEDAVLTCGYVPHDIISWPFGEDKGAMIVFTSHGVYKLSKNVAENPENYSMTFLYDYPVPDYYGTSYRAIAKKNYVITYGENLSYIAIKKNGSGFDGFEKISISTIGSSASVGKIVAYDEEQSMILLSDKKIAMVDGEGNLEMTSMVFPVNPSKHCNFMQTNGVFFATSGRDIYRSADKGITWEKYDPYTGKSSLYSSYDTRGAFPVLQNVGNIIVGLLKENNDTCHIIATKDGSTWEEVGKKIELNTSLAICSWKIYRDRLFLQPYQGALYEMSALLGQADIKDQVTNIADRVCKIESKTEGGTGTQIVTIGSVTAAASLDISGKAKKITLLVKKVTATATTGAAIYQYINLSTTQDGVTAPKLSALTAAISTSHGTIAVSGGDILLKSVKGFSITAIIDYKNY